MKWGPVGIGSVVPLVALGDAAQRFGRAEGGVVGGGVANGFAFECRSFGHQVARWQIGFCRC